MPGVGEVLALPAPPPGGLTDGTPALQIVPSSNGPAEAVPEKPKPPASVATQTNAIGIIHPPPDIRSIVDKTAGFVARNGPEFEKKILATNKGNVKFNFLTPTDPSHAYYRHKIAEVLVQLGQPPQEAAAAAASADGSAAASSTPGAAAPAVQKPVPPPPGTLQAILADAKTDMRGAGEGKPLAAPDTEQYTVRVPEGLSGLDLDVIKLTAQFVARNGKSFLTGLISREHTNPQFNFLKPTHSLFTFFTALADAYSKVLMPPKQTLERVRRDAGDGGRAAVLARCHARVDWERLQARQRKKEEDEIERERVQMALIDWHDFVVVETIEFADDEESELPPPVTLEEVIRKSKQLAADEELAPEDAAAVAAAQQGGKGGAPRGPPGAAAEAARKEAGVGMDEEELALVQESMRAAAIAEEGEGGEKGGVPPPPPPPGGAGGIPPPPVPPLPAGAAAAEAAGGEGTQDEVGGPRGDSLECLEEYRLMKDAPMDCGSLMSWLMVTDLCKTPKQNRLAALYKFW